MRRIVATALVLIVLAGCAGTAKLSGGGRELEALRYLPGDSVLAWGTRLETLVSITDAFTDLARSMAPEADLDEALAPLRAWEAQVGIDLRDDLLRNLGREMAFGMSLEGIDQLVAAVAQMAQSQTPDLDAVPLEMIVIVGVSDAGALDAAVERLATSLGATFAVTGAGLRTISAVVEETPLTIHYRIDRGFLVLGKSAASLDAAVARAAEGTGLAASPGLEAVSARLRPGPDSLAYLDLPRVKTLVESSFMLQAYLASQPDAQPIYKVLVQDNPVSEPAIWTSYNVEGGVMRQSFFPDQGAIGQLIGPGAASRLGIIAAIAVPNFLNAVDRGKQRRTMADIRALAQACEQHQIDTNVYPGPTEGFVEVDRVAGALEGPVYIRFAPRTDGWGHPILYWSDGQSYVILSPGKDGVRDWSPDDMEPVGTTTYDADIVYRDGVFLRYPTGPQG